MKFFFSYSRSVKEQLKPIIDLLLAADHEVWWDDDITPIADWWASILDHIEWCEVFVFVVSEKSVQSPYCLEEHRYADARNRPILPFIIDDRSRYTIPPEITPFRQQWYEHDGDPARLLRHIKGAIGQIQLEDYPDYPTLRPPEPNKGSGSLIQQYQQAVRLAEDGHFGEAVKHFRNVASLDRRQWGKKCDQWVIRLRLYEEVAELATEKSTHPEAREKWSRYLETYDADFDPLDIRGKSERASPPLSSPPPDRIASVATGDLNVRATPGGEVIGRLQQGVSVTLGPDAPQAEGVYQWRRITRPLDGWVADKYLSFFHLPLPFAWVPIPAGKVTLEAGGFLSKATTFDVPAFEMAKYPLTNAQFLKFIQEAGYKCDEWWIDGGGWVVWEEQGWQEPRFWKDSQWNQPDHPVVGVSWYEAIAFCLWLSDATGENITLPTEQQWQRAAQGNDHRTYPWGAKFDASRCNSSVAGKSAGTTPVDQFEGRDRGDSPFNVTDMTGNVWEWCLTDFRTGAQDIHESAEARVVRGGAWVNVLTHLLRTANRDWLIPGTRNVNLGFRCVRSL